MASKRIWQWLGMAALLAAVAGCPRGNDKQGKDEADDVQKLGNYALVATVTDNVSREVCQERAQELMLKHPDLQCLIGLWAYNPPALLLAVQNSKVKPVVVGFDEDDATLEGIRAGACYATVVQNPYEFGYQSITILAGLAQGKDDVLKKLRDSKTKEPLTIDSDNRIFIPHRVITRSNVDAFQKDLKQLMEKGDTAQGNKDAGDKLRVAFVSNNAEAFWSIAERGSDKAAADLGVTAIFRKPPNGTKEEQQQIIEDLLNTGVKGIAVSPNDAANSVDFFKQIAAKVPLVMQDSDLPDTSARRCYIGTNNYRAGLAVGELVTKAVPKGGKIAIFVGKLDVENARERRQGVLDYLTGPQSVK